VEEAAAEAIESLTNHRNFHAASSITRRFIVVRFHKPFWGESKLRRGNKKPFPPERKKWPTIASDT
jgi:hypothetical protein